MSEYHRALAFHLASALCKEDLILMIVRAKDWNMHPEERAVYNELLDEDGKRALTDPDHPLWQIPGYRMYRPKKEV